MFQPLVLLALLDGTPLTMETPRRELIVVLAPQRAGERAEAPSLLAGLGLSTRRTLADVLPSGAPIAVPPFFALDPERVLLLAAADPPAAAAAAKVLAASPDVAWVEPNVERSPAHAPPDGFPDDPLFVDSRQWGLRNLGPAGVLGGHLGADIDALGAWARSVGGEGVLLAVADTGIDPNHPDLDAALPGGGRRLVHGIDITTPHASFADTYGHGTPVAGVMAARTGDGPHFDSLGVAGVCGGDGAGNPGCRIVPIKVTRGNAGSATSFDLAAAILYAARLGARAVNVSFAGGGPSRLERLAMHHAVVRGCLTVTASGNRGFADGRAPQYPAAYAADGLGIQVGASDPFDERAVFSSYGPGLDLLAPGVDVWSTFMTYPSAAGASYPGYARVSGTSFAAPFVTGTVGLLAAARPELSGDDVRQILRATARDVGPPGPDSLTGRGRLDAARALAAVRPGIGVWHDEVAALTTRSMGWDTLVVGEAGEGHAQRWRGPLLAECFELEARVALPDSFADSLEVWPRIGGTTTIAGSSRLPYLVPWATVAARGARTFTLRGYGYRVSAAHCPACEAPDRELPLPLDQARFGFTVLGRLKHPAAVRPDSRAPMLAAAPNPFGTTTWIAVRGARRVEIFDVSGRRVRTLEVAAAEGGSLWDGRDASARLVPPGVYLARAPGTRPGPTLKLVRLR